MTNEEIKNQLQDIKCHCQEMYEAEIKNGDSSSSIWGKDVEALDLAIKALEQQPCGDCISREAVRRILANQRDELVKLHTVNPKDNPKADAMAYGVNWSLNTLMELPSVTPKGVTITDFADRCRECGREKVLDKISAEIEHLHDWAFSREEILRIIDKYKAESDKESEE